MRARVLVFLLVAVAVTGLAPDAGPRSPPDVPVGALAPTAGLAIVANESFATLGDPLAFRAWVNLTGGGFLPRTWLNLTFPAELRPDGGNASSPAGCVTVGNLSWQCNGLRAGSYLWIVPASVARDAAVGAPYAATAAGATYDAGVYTTLDPVSAAVIVTGANIEITLALNGTASAGGLVVVTAIAINSNRFCQNDTYCEARDVRLRAAVDPLLAVRAGDPLYLNATSLSNGSEVSLTFAVIVPADAVGGALFWLDVTVEYRDFDDRPLPVERAFAVVRVEPGPFPADPWLVLVVALGAVLGTLAVLLVWGQQALRIEELFLMHSSGILIRHISRAAGLAKDDEIVASMLVAVQDFVRDSFRSQATLDEFRFTGRRAAIVRGKHTILAAIVSRGDVRYLVPQLRAALEDLERAHGAVLARWDGRMSRLERAGPIFDRLLRGGYRGVGALAPSARGFLERLRQGR